MLLEICILLTTALIAVKMFSISSISAIFNLVWAISFLLISYSLTDFQALDHRFVVCIILVGLFSLACDFLFIKLRSQNKERPINFVIHFKLITVALILFFPFFLRQIIAISETGIGGNLLFRIRYATLQNGGSIGITSIVVLLSSFHAVASLQFHQSIGKYWVAIALTLAISMQILTAARTGLIILICAALIMFWLNQKSSSIRSGFAAILTIFASFAVTSWFRSSSTYGNNTDQFDLLAQLHALGKGMSLYLGSGPVAFSQIIDSSSSIISEQYIWNNIKNFIGVGEESISGILPYSYVPIATNIYSMFLPYYSYGGWIFIALFAVFLLLGLSFLFRMAKSGSKISALIYAFGAAFMVQSPIGDGFLVGIPVWIQLAAYIFVMYIAFPAIFRKSGGIDDLNSDR